MSKHTPGPWEVTGEVRLVGDADSEGAWNLYCADVNPASEPDKYLGAICNLQSADHIKGISREEAKANAHLIAAAPDLLRVVKAYFEWDYANHGGEDTAMRLADARAAIAKAEGA